MGNSHKNKKAGFYTPTSKTKTNSPFPDIKPTTGSNTKKKKALPVIVNGTLPTNSALDQMLDEIDDEINRDYTNGNQNSMNNTYTVVGQFPFVPQKNYIHKITDLFTYHKQLGSGASGRVLLVSDKKTKSRYALKEMHKNHKLNKVLFVNEYNILKQIKHKNIIKYIDSWIDKNCYYLATNYCSGGTMLDRIIAQGHFSERACADFMKDVLMAMKYLHSLNIAHRDIKCANLVFDKKGNDGILKIIDFGSSELIKNKNEIDEFIIGSLHYLSPEMISSAKRTKKNLFKGDLWAIGVVCYILVAGQLPFSGQNKGDILKKIQKGRFKWPKNVKLSVSCKAFVSSLLKKDINLRYNAQEALNHEWIISKATNDLFDDVYLSQIQTFHQANKLQKILINAVLSEMEQNDKKILLKAIRDLDINGNRQINENDIINYILLHAPVEKQQKKVIQKRAKVVLSEIRNGIMKMSDYDLKKLPIIHDKHMVSLNADDVDDILQELIDDNVLTDSDDDDQKSMTPNTYISDHDKSGSAMFDIMQNDDHKDDLVVNAKKLDLYNFSHSPVPATATATATATSITPLDNDDNSNSVPSTSLNDRKISVEQFTSLISKSQKTYDVDKLVLQLKPTNSHRILLSNITNFNKEFHSSNSIRSNPFKK